MGSKTTSLIDFKENIICSWYIERVNLNLIFLFLTLFFIINLIGQSGPQNVKLFFQAEGEKPLIKECLLSPSENVHLTALEIIYGLMKTSPEARATMFKEGLEDNAKKCQQTVLTQGSKVYF
jgi:hypothetical protein